MKEIRKIKSAVIETLVKYPKTRANDNELVYRVLTKLKMPTDYKELRSETANIVESICRCRRLAQNSNPMLRPEKQVSARRKKLEENYRKEMHGI